MHPILQMCAILRGTSDSDALIRNREPSGEGGPGNVSSQCEMDALKETLGIRLVDLNFVAEANAWIYFCVAHCLPFPVLL